MSAKLEVDLAIAADGWTEALPGVAALVRAAGQAAWSATEGETAAELCVLLSDDAAIRVLNARHREKDSATNVLAFPMGEDVYPAGPRHLGDVVLALETIRGEAERDGKSLEAHVSHLVVHGLLHLLDYDHLTADEAAAMEAVEVSVLAELGYGNPYLVLADAAE